MVQNRAVFCGFTVFDTEFPPTSSHREVAKMTSHEARDGRGWIQSAQAGRTWIQSALLGLWREQAEPAEVAFGARKVPTLRSCTDGAIPPGFQKEFEVFAESIGGASQRMARKIRPGEKRRSFGAAAPVP